MWWMIVDVLVRGTRDMPFRSTTIAAATAALLTVLALSASGQNSNVRADADPAAVESVKKFEIKLCDLLVRGEWDSYAGHLTDDYVRIIPGKIQGKEDVLNEFRSSNVKTISMVPEKMDVRIYGDTAVMIIQLRFRERAPDGKTTDKLGRPTKVFVRRHGQWYLAQLVGSPLNQ
jgi:ketosteroid isomerase-like protein